MSDGTGARWWKRRSKTQDKAAAFRKRLSRQRLFESLEPRQLMAGEVTIIDNSDTTAPFHFSRTANGWRVGLIENAGYGNNYTAGNNDTDQGLAQYAPHENLGGNGTATWNFPLAAGLYDVSTTWVSAANRRTAAPYVVSQAILGDRQTPALTSRSFNQQQSPNDFTDIDGNSWEIITVSGPVWLNVGASGGGSLVVDLNNFDSSNTLGWTIADAVRVEDRTPTLAVTSLASAINETGGQSAFRISRLDGANVPLTVKYTLAGSATVGVDYSVTSGTYSGGQGTITLPQGQSFVDVTIAATSDTAFEGTESIQFSLQAGTTTNSIYRLGTSSAAMNITDDDKPTIKLEAIDNTGAEQGPDNLTFRVTRDGPQFGVDIGSYAVNYTIATGAGMATNGVDYSTLSGTVTIAQNQLFANIVVAVIADTTYESAETVQLQLAASPSVYNIGSPSTASGTIIADRPTVTVEAIGGLAESAVGTTARFRFTRTGPTTSALTTSYQLSGSAVVSSDFTRVGGGTPTSVTFAAGSATADVEWQVVDDVRFEGTENIVATLIGSSSDYVVGGGPATIDITDNDKARVYVTTLDASAAERALPNLAVDPGSFVIARPSDDRLDQALTVNFTLSSSAPGDYTVSLGSPVTIPAGQLTSAPIVITPIQDTISEPQRTVQLIITPSSDYVVTTSGGDVVTIAADPPTVSLSGGGSIAEDASGAVTVQLQVQAAVTPSVSVPLQISGTATNSVDYATIGNSIFVSGSPTSYPIDVDPTDDDTYEGDETVVLSIPAPTNLAYVLGSSSPVTVTIIEDDLPKVTIVADDPAAAERGDNPGRFRVDREGITTSALTVYYTVGGTAATNGDDYTPLSGSITIPMGSSFAYIDVTPQADFIQEPAETVIVTLSTDSEYETESPDTATVTIEADPPTVTLTAYDPDAAEAGPDHGAFRITRSGATTASLTVLVQVVGASTATPGEDYVALSTTAVIPVGETFIDVPVTVLNDEAVEISETVILSLAASSDYIFDSSVSDNTSSTVTIVSDDKPKLTIQGVTDTEGDLGTGTPPISKNFEFFVSLSAPVDYDITVDFATADGDAVAGEDYVAANGTLTIEAGDTHGMIPVGIIGDKIKEEDEKFYLSLSNLEGATPEGPQSVEGVITNDDKSKTACVNCEVIATATSAVVTAVSTVIDVMGGNSKTFLEAVSQYTGVCLTCLTSQNPHPIAKVNMTLPEGPLPGVLEAKFNFGPLPTQSIFYNTSGLVGGQEVEFTLQVDAGTLPSDYYTYDVEVVGHGGASMQPFTTRGETFVFNRKNSEFGNRWWAGELDRVVVHDDGIALVRGDGTGAWYKEDGAGGFVTPLGIHSNLHAVSGGYELRHSDGGKDEFDSAGLLVARRDRNGNAVTYNYVDADSDGNAWEVSQITDAFGRASSFTYTAGFLTSITNFAGQTTEFVHNTQGLLTKIKQPDPDGAGPLAAPEYQFVYNADKLLQQTIDPLGRTQTLTYDAALRATGGINADGTTWQVTSIESAGVVNTAMIGYDLAHPAPSSYLLPTHEATYTDERGAVTRTEVDGFGYPTKVTDALGGVTRYERNGDGQRTKVVLPDPDADGPLGELTTRFEYGERGRLTKVVHPDGTTQHWEYESTFGQLTRHIDELGHETLFTVDPTNGNTLTSRVIVGANDLSSSESDDLVTTFTYTTSSDGVPAGLILTETDGRGHITRYAYLQTAGVNHGRLLSVTLAYGTADAATTSYEYDAAGNLSAVVDPLGQRTAYVYDALNRLVKVIEADPDGLGPLKSPVTTYVYDAANQLRQTIDPRGGVTTFDYDLMGRNVRTTLPDAGVQSTPENIVVDDGSAEFALTGTSWVIGQLAGGFQGDYRAAASGSGDQKAAWTVNGLVPGKKYEVYATWVADANRASNATYAVKQGTSSVNLTANQKNAPTDDNFGGTKWARLGVIDATATFATVELTNSANGYVIADGLRFVEVKSTIVDDGDVGYSENQPWTAGGLTGAYGADYRVRPAGTGQYKATWTFPALTPGKIYEVFVTYLADANRADNAVFTVKDNGAQILAATVNQKLAPDSDFFGGFKWKSLGQVVPGGVLTVELTDAANGYVIADAIRIVEVDPAAVDDGTNGFQKTGSGWTAAAATTSVDGDYWVKPAGTGVSAARWLFGDAEVGARYEVYVSWAAFSGRTDAARYDVKNGSAVEFTATVNQRNAPADAKFGGKAFKSLGVVTAQGALQVDLFDSAAGSIAADAVRFVKLADDVALPGPAEVIIDDGETGYAEPVGEWSDGTLLNGNAGDYRYAAASGGAATAVATWTFDDLPIDAMYEVLVTWREHGNRATNAPYAVTEGTQQVATVYANQQSVPPVSYNGRQWLSLGAFRIQSGSLRVDLSNNANGYVIADAVRIRRVSAPTAPIYTRVYDATGNLVSETDPLGRKTSIGYDLLGRPTSLVEADPDGATGPLTAPASTFVYGATGWLLSATNANEATTRFEYDARGRQTKEIQPHPTSVHLLDVGPTTTWEYDAAGRLTVEIDPLNRRTDYEYDSANRVTKVKEPAPNPAQPLVRPITQLEYDRASNVTAIVDPLLNRTEFSYDTLDRRIEMKEEDPDGISGLQTHPITTWTYDAASRVTHLENARGFVTEYIYDALNRVTKIKEADPDGIGSQSSPEWLFSYDVVGNLLSQTDPRGNATRYRYDQLNRLVEATEADPDGAGSQRSPVSRWTYDLAGQLVAAIDPLGRTTNTAYDRLGRVVAVTEPDPDGAGALTRPVTTFTYDAVGNLLDIVDATGSKTTYEYDRLNRPTKMLAEDPSQRGGTNRPQTTWTYDLAGQLLSVTDPLSRTWSNVYDGLGQLKQTTSPDPDGAANPLLAPFTAYTYDLNGNVTRQSDGLGHGTSIDYDKLDRPFLLTDDRGGETVFRYDAVGNRTQLIDPVGNATSWVYDGLNRVVTETNELHDSRHFVYDAIGNLVQKTDRLGRVTEYVYDALNRNTAEKWLDGSSAVIREMTFAYDAASQLTSAADPAAAYTYGYDGLGRLTSQTQAIAGLPTVQFASTFNAVGRRESLQATIGGTADFKNTYEYDALHRLESLSQGANGGHAVAAKQVDFAYNAAGQKTSVTRKEDSNTVLATSIGYDLAGRLKSIAHGSIAGYTYDYDRANRITAIDSLLDGLSEFNYDETDQLIGADHANQSDEAYEFDLNGNRVMEDHEVGANNRLETDGVFNYEYDAEGNQTAKVEISTGNRTEYGWDHRNRLVTITEKDSSGTVLKTVDQTYDVFNQWIKRSVDDDGPGAGSAVDTYFAYEDSQIVLEWQDSDGPGTNSPTLTHRYLWDNAIDQLLADEQVSSTSSPGNVIWPLTDHLGTVRDAVDLDGLSLDHVLHRVYNAFGSLEIETNPSNPSAAAADVLFGFTGRPFDNTTRLGNHLHRWYDALIGQWKSEDPNGLAPDVNTRRYVGNAPLSDIDPTGLEGFWSSVGSFFGFRSAPKKSYDEIVKDDKARRDLTLIDAIKDRDLSAGEIHRLNLTECEIKEILASVNPDAMDNTFYTGKTLSKRLRELADEEFGHLPADQRYALKAQLNNAYRARGALLFRNPAVRSYVPALYEQLRSVNPVHFVAEKGFVVGSGHEPVLNEDASRLAAGRELVLYFVLLRGTSWAQAKLKAQCTGTTYVTRGGRPGLQDGDFVMEGQFDSGAYIASGKWQPGGGNQFAGPGSFRNFQVPTESLSYPSGADWWKGMLGQRIYVGPPMSPTSVSTPPWAAAHGAYIGPVVTQYPSEE
jgi:RHS repeat-associated protein